MPRGAASRSPWRSDPRTRFRTLDEGSLLAALVFCVAAVALAQPAPEAATGRTPKEAVVGSRFMAVAAHPLAVDAGYGILKRGGNAIDAAVAMQLVLGLVEPQSSGIGGGGFILHYSAADKRVRAYDGRETAPAAARPERFIGLYGRPLGFMEAVLSGRAVGVPGTIAVLELAHRKHGRLPWHELARARDRARRARLPGHAAPARAARVGPVPAPRSLRRRATSTGPTANRSRSGRSSAIRTTPRCCARLRRAGRRPSTAARSRATSWRRCRSTRSSRAISRSPTSKAMPRRSAHRSAARSGPTACAACRRRARAASPCCRCSASSSGCRKTDYPRDPAAAVHFFAEAGRLAYADRDRYVADPDFVDVPVAGLIAPDYLAERGGARRARPLAAPGAGRPAARCADRRARRGRARARGDDPFLDRRCRGQRGGVDVQHRVRVRQPPFRARVPAQQPADRLRVPVGGGRRRRSRTASRAASGRAVRCRRRWCSTPTAGSCSSPARPAGTRSSTTSRGWWWRRSTGRWACRRRSTLPHFGSRNGPTEVESGTSAERLRAPLAALGHDVRVHEMTSGVHAIRRVGEQWIGAADPRREGIARGE